MDQRSIDDGALTQRQTAVTEIAIDDGQDAGSQFVFLKQTAEVEDGGFVGNALQAQPGELTQDGRLVERFFRKRPLSTVLTLRL